MNTIILFLVELHVIIWVRQNIRFAQYICNVVLVNTAKANWQIITTFSSFCKMQWFGFILKKLNHYCVSNLQFITNIKLSPLGGGFFLHGSNSNALSFLFPEAALVCCSQKTKQNNNSKYFYLLIFITAIGFSGNAQIGVGVPNGNPSAILDLKSNNKGLLIPRLALSSSTDATTITKGNVDGLLVFNTQTASDIAPGFYYWFNAKWNRVLLTDEIAGNSPVTTNQLTLAGTELTSTVNGVTSNVADLSGLKWGLAGNEATAASFLGTTNDEPLRFKTANEDRMTIGTNGRVSINTPLSGYALAVRSATNDENIASFLPNNETEGIAIGFSGISKIGTRANTNLRISPKNEGKINLDGPVIIKTLTAGTADEDVVVVDADNNLKKIASASLGKTYTAGTGIDITGTEISATTANKLDLVEKNLTTTVNGISDTIDLTPALVAAATVSNTVEANRLSTTVNGVTGAQVPIINSNVLTFTGTELTSTINGETSTVANLSGLSGWGLEGNAGTATSFIGTTNAESLKFKTANEGRMTIAADGNIGIGTAPSDFAFDLVSKTNDENMASFITANRRSGVAIGSEGLRMGGSVVDATFRIAPKGAGKIHLDGPVHIENLREGVPGESVVVVDAENNLKKIASASVGKTYTAGTGINVTGTVIRATTTNTLTGTDGNLISTVNNATTPPIAIVTTADNGLAVANGTVTLGGELTTATTIAATLDHSLSLAGLPVTTNLDTDHVIVADSEGMLKRTPAATFFNKETTVSNTSLSNKFSTTVNGITGNEVDLVKDVTLTENNGNLTVSVNGVVGTPSVAIVSSATNGLTRTNGTVVLGGNLTKPTVITTDAVNTLSIMNLSVSTTGATDAALVVGTDGTLKKALIASSDFLYDTALIAPGASEEVILDLNSSFANLIVSATNTCARIAMAVFTTYDDLLVYKGGQAGNRLYTARITSGLAGNIQTLNVVVPTCEDGGNEQQFDFAVQKAGNKIIITNNGNVAKRYALKFMSR